MPAGSAPHGVHTALADHSAGGPRWEKMPSLPPRTRAGSPPHGLATELAGTSAGGPRSPKGPWTKKNGGAPHGLATRPADTLAGGLRIPLRRKRNSGVKSLSGEQPEATLLASISAGGES